jgi:cation diffusion facilitator CzcD-associated flavoprotein CzcO
MAAAEATGGAASPRIGPAVLDALVVGAGQAGLAAGYHLKRASLSFEILEARGEPGGSWPGYYDSLTLFSPARRHVDHSVMEPTSATPDNAVRAKFAERAFHALGCIEEL